MDVVDFLNQFAWFGNTAWDYIAATAVVFGVAFAMKIFQVAIVARLNVWARKTETEIDDVVIDMVKNVSKLFYLVVSVYAGLRWLTLPEIADTITQAVFLVVLVYEVIRAAQAFVNYGMQAYVTKSKAEGEEINRSMIQAGKLVVGLVLWALGTLMVLSNLGVNVTSLIASLGIGGIAVALALQNVLSDFFSSFSIYMDKPFQVGDFVILGQDSGTVKKIGLKTTRIKTLRGEELVVSNQELTSTRIQNLKRMENRRETLIFGVTYQTKKKQIEKIPAIVKEIIDSVDKATFDRSHFSAYGPSSLDFETVYYIEVPDYDTYMDVKQEVNLKLFEAFEKEKIEFAYPTQTIFVEKGN